ncbi:MAG: cysteine peptidase family C39 domain-containing protein [Planctomycetota bacterium]
MALPPSVEICFVGSLALLALTVGVRVSERVSRARPYLLAASLFISLAYAWTFSGRIGWISSLPIDSVMIWSNLMPVMLAFTVGLACRSEKLSGRRQPVAIGLLGMLAIGYIVSPQVRSAVAPLNFDSITRWDDGICLQSHPASCAPAAAATLLLQSGIRSTEQSLAQVCSSSSYGTEPTCLFRGLAVASRHSSVSPVVASTDPEEWVQLNQLPNISLVRFERYERQRTFDRLVGNRGDGHAIVVMGRTEDGRWKIADPAFGKTIWSDSQFRDRFTGDAIFLEHF